MDSEISKEIEHLFKHNPISREIADKKLIEWLEGEDNSPMTFNNFSKLLVIKTSSSILIEHVTTKRKRNVELGFYIEKIIVNGKNEIFVKRKDGNWSKLVFEPLNSLKYILEEE